MQRNDDIPVSIELDSTINSVEKFKIAVERNNIAGIHHFIRFYPHLLNQMILHDDINETLFTYVIKLNRRWMIEALLASRDVNPDTPNSVGQTPLILAIKYLDSDLLQKLSQDDRVNLSAVDGAEHNIIYQIISTVLEYKADVSLVEQLNIIHGMLALIPEKTNLSIHSLSHDDASVLILLLNKLNVTKESCSKEMIRVIRKLRQFNYFVPNIQNQDGMTFLMAAAKQDGQLAEYLCSIAEVDVNLKNKDGSTAFHYAAAAATPTAANTLLTVESCSVNQANHAGIVPLILARYAGHDEVVTGILRCLGFDGYVDAFVNNPDLFGEITHHLILDNIRKMLSMDTIAKETIFKLIDLIAGEAEKLVGKNDQDHKYLFNLVSIILGSQHIQIKNDGQPLIIQSIKNKREALASVLIRSGLCSLSTQADGLSLLNLAYDANLKTIFYLLLQARASLDQPCLMSSKPILIKAVLARDIQCVQALLQYYPEINLNQVDSEGRTAIYYAILNNDRECVKLLLASSRHINIYILDNIQISPYMIASTHQYDEILSMLNTYVVMNGMPSTLAQRLAVIGIPLYEVPPAFRETLDSEFMQDYVTRNVVEKYVCEKEARRKMLDNAAQLQAQAFVRSHVMPQPYILTTPLSIMALAATPGSSSTTTSEAIPVHSSQRLLGGARLFSPTHQRAQSIAQVSQQNPASDDLTDGTEENPTWFEDKLKAEANLQSDGKSQPVKLHSGGKLQRAKLKPSAKHQPRARSQHLARFHASKKTNVDFVSARAMDKEGVNGDGAARKRVKPYNN